MNTDFQTISRITNWHKNPNSILELPTLNELISLVSKIEDEETFELLRETFTDHRHHYHPEQTLLINAHLWGRQQYLSTFNVQR